MKFHIENFGCQMNVHDMEKVDHLLHTAGLERAGDLDGADVVIVNTCCIREKAEQKFYSLMGRLRMARRRRSILIGVTGCIAQLEKESLLKKLPFIDFSLGPSSIHRVSEAVEAASHKRRLLDFSDNGCTESLFVRPGVAAGSLQAYVTIMKGCNNFCSYCIVPYVRGREASRPSRNILEEVGLLARDGVREVTLLGQNVNSYNKGSSDMTFPQLLASVNGIDGIERIRFVTSHPRDLSPDLIDCFGRVEKLCEHIHLPFQSGSDRILGLMNRGYTAKEYLEKVDRLRRRCANIAITADCIVGFPGEDEEDFDRTMNLVKDVGFDGVFSFCFSSRRHTRAAELAGRVPGEIAMERLRTLQTVQKAETLNKNKQMEGTKVEVLVEGPSKNSKKEFTGRTRTSKIVNFEGTTEMLGRLVELEVARGYANSLKGTQPKCEEV